VPVLVGHGGYKPYLRVDFWYSCAYCTIAETEATAIGFEIDHHQPKTAGGTDVYENLMWSCKHGNELKLDLWPPDEARAKGLRFFRPDQDQADDHFELSGEEIIPKTSVGEFTKEILDLNRQTLLDLRRLRRRLFAATEALLEGVRGLRKLSIQAPEVRTVCQTLGDHPGRACGKRH